MDQDATTRFLPESGQFDGFEVETPPMQPRRPHSPGWNPEIDDPCSPDGPYPDPGYDPDPGYEPETGEDEVPYDDEAPSDYQTLFGDPRPYRTT